MVGMGCGVESFGGTDLLGDCSIPDPLVDYFILDSGVNSVGSHGLLSRRIRVCEITRLATLRMRKLYRN